MIARVGHPAVQRDRAAPRSHSLRIACDTAEQHLTALLGKMRGRLDKGSAIDDLLEETLRLGDVATEPILAFLEEMVSGPSAAARAIEDLAEALYREMGASPLRFSDDAADPEARIRAREHNTKCLEARRAIDEDAWNRMEAIFGDPAKLEASGLPARLRRLHVLHGALILSSAEPTDLLRELEPLTLEDVVYLRARNDDLFRKDGSLAVIARRWAELLPAIAIDRTRVAEKLSSLLLEGGPYVDLIADGLIQALGAIDRPSADAALELTSVAVHPGLGR